jgi:hypothetical protein
MTTNIDNISELFACYFHQDWPNEYENDTSAIQDIINMEPKAQIAAAISELDSILLMNLNEKELETFTINKLGCYFNPASKKQTYYEWLRDVNGIFKKLIIN